jgi:hypothetical protein
MWRGLPAGWRDRLRPCSGADLLAALASLSFVAGVALALVAADLSLTADIPLWNAALIVCALAILASVLCFPGWWEGASRWGASARACAGARERRASHTVDMVRARSPRARRRPDRPGAHRTAGALIGGPLAGARRRSRAEWLVAARRRDGMPRMQRGHGRQRG